MSDRFKGGWSYSERVWVSYQGPLPELFKRFVDDGIYATSMPHSELENFISFVCIFHPALQFEYQITSSYLLFLNITFQITDNHTTTSIFYKKSDSHSYLHNDSSHNSSDTISGPKNTFHIHQHFTCASVCVIYSITCIRCFILYIGETCHQLNARFGEHLRSVEQMKHLSPEYQDDNFIINIEIHFNVPNHSVNDLEISALLQPESTVRISARELLFSCHPMRSCDAL